MYIVRIGPIKQFFLCSTRSSDGTHAKFDFDDPAQCQICFGINPFKEEPIEGEQLIGDEEPSKDSEDEDKGDENKDEEGDGSGETSFRFSQNKKEDGDTAESDEDEEEESEDK